jgi:flagellar L-ring protein precursor FlgH
MTHRRLVLAGLALGVIPADAGWRKNSPPPQSQIERYIEEATARAATSPGSGASPGSLYGAGGRLGDMFRDQRAYQLDDLVTIIVSDQASAVASGVTNSSRKANKSAAITALAGAIPGTAPLANLANLGGESKLDGQGQTSRTTQLSTTLSARVTHVLPNGYLVVQGTKEIAVNSERQVVSVRGVCRPQDLATGNTILSNQLAQLDVKINGKGVVNDAIRRPFILYRILEGLLPF